ncbi:MAG: segregation/condensation protein A [Candidatus Sungbacteria bacterium]|uniref:Segregation and condensation protein A n=1 Tax=Candidatus Sungiibacteriota bacterium TaxID=2750080 RepID=A0A932YY10_9BACT|nr:segregation/condensation protein A [Candidatus Sungbacteria bacterium]
MAYQVKQEKFEGPLDLLLELIQQEKLSINEISLAKVTDDFIGYLKALQTRLPGGLAAGEADQLAQIKESETWAGQEVLAEFLVVAAQLLLIKSRSLLPQFAASPEEEESIAELERRLAEYQRFKSLAVELGRMAKGGPKSFSREAYAGTAPLFYPPKRFSIAMLAEAFSGVLAVLPKIEKLAEEKIRKIISLEEKIQELQAFLQERVERAFSEIVSGAREKIEVIISFLALLELAKQKFVTVEQQHRFGDIKIRRAA